MSGQDNTSYTTRTVAGTTTVTLQDSNILVLVAVAPVVVTIPATLLAIAGRELSVYKDAAAQTVTITPASGLIDGAATLVLASGAKHGWNGVTDGTNWYSLGVY